LLKNFEIRSAKSMAAWVQRQAWSHVFASHPHAAALFVPGNEAALAAALESRPRLRQAMSHLGPPPPDLVHEVLAGKPTKQHPKKRVFSMVYKREDATLTPAQLRQFFEDGYIHVQGAVPAAVIDAALRIVNAAIGRGALADHTTPGADPKLVSLPGPDAAAPSIVDLFHGSKLPTLTQQLVGLGKVAPPAFGQIALRFPAPPVEESQTRRPWTPRGRAWHVDGFQRGAHSPFTLLVGVCLSDCDDPTGLAGNFAVHPGAHWGLQEAVKQAAASGSGTLSDHGWSDAKPDLGPPRPVLMRRGDVVLAHQKLPHLGMPNYSPAIRYQVYFRVAHRDLDAHRDQWLDDLLLPFEGLRAALGV